MITLCELSFVDGTHAPFNAGLLATIREAFPNEGLVFNGAAAHIVELRQQVGEPLADSISWKTIVPPRPGAAYLRRFCCELKIIRSLLRDAQQHLTWPLILTSAYPSTVLALKFARSWGCRQIPVQVVLHGMSGVVGRRYRHPIRRLQDTKTALTVMGNKGIKYLVLEENIRRTVLTSIPSLRPHIAVLEHPVSVHEGGSQISDFSSPIQFGFLGLALKSKGFPLFVETAQAITARYEKHAEFHAIGRLAEEGKLAQRLDVLATKPTYAQLPRADFLAAISKVHFIVLPYDSAFYSLTASGVLLDAIAFQKPIIARKMPMFETMFEKHGDIGYLFDNDIELQGTIEEILQVKDKSRYQRQVCNLKNLRESRVPQALAKAYRGLYTAHVGGLG
jgi:hypothetical protein